MKKINRLLNFTFLKFVLVGIINTLVGIAVMFIFYNVLKTNYWISSASNYVVGSIVSYFLNKYFTFKNNKQSVKQVVTFIINIIICYLIAYGLAKPFVSWILNGQNQVIKDNMSMMVGMVFFVIMNYVGQRLIVFKENDEVE